LLVEKIMTKDVVTIDCNETVLDACKKYKDLKVGCFVVMDGTILVGIVTERDIIERGMLMEKDPRITKIREIMSSNLKTVHALAPIERAAEIMRENNIKKLPVILNNEIVGIVTETDLTRTINAFTEGIEELIEFYSDSKNSIEKIMDEWGNLLINLKGYKKLAQYKEKNVIERKI